MRYLVTPEFNNKIMLFPQKELAKISSFLERFKVVDSVSFLNNLANLKVQALGDGVYLIKVDCYRLYASLGKDNHGDYLLFLDIAQEGQHINLAQRFYATKDPVTNFQFNPQRNMTIDPNRNMTIDPNRNMTIDPNRNMMIDPNRNMTIDPNRNMTIDPNRNMTIDPNRNMMIDPNRNMMIDPRRNRFWGGPFVYTVDIQQVGFIIKANDQVNLIFSCDAKFVQFGVQTAHGNINIFNVNCVWEEFWVKTNSSVYLRFATNNRWLGFVV